MPTRRAQPASPPPRQPGTFRQDRAADVNRLKRHEILPFMLPLNAVSVNVQLCYTAAARDPSGQQTAESLVRSGSRGPKFPWGESAGCAHEGWSAVGLLSPEPVS